MTMIAREECRLLSSKERKRCVDKLERERGVCQSREQIVRSRIESWKSLSGSEHSTGQSVVVHFCRKPAAVNAL